MTELQEVLGSARTAVCHLLSSNHSAECQWHVPADLLNVQQTPSSTQLTLADVSVFRI